MPTPRGAAGRHAAEQEGRRLALAAVFEAEFGQRTAHAVLERTLADGAVPEAAAALARHLVDVVARDREDLDTMLARLAPAHPVVSLARMDRALLRCALGEVLHSPATPMRVAIAEWVGLARTFSGEPARRLVNGVLGRVASEVVGTDSATDSHRAT
ncbi:MAG TPA: transcription antitermination factor NusB [Candidatus Limnocylindrales bacterium]